MATQNKILIQDGDQVVELTGADKETFLADRKATIAWQANLDLEQQTKKDLQKSAYAKLGLTEEEINAIL
jgi:uncharacterized protein (AIM24 family)